MNASKISQLVESGNHAGMQPLRLGLPGSDKPEFIGALAHAADRAFKAAFGNPSHAKLVTLSKADASREVSLIGLVSARESAIS